MTEILAQFGAQLGSVLASAPAQLGARVILGYVVLVWLAAAIWVFVDCRRRMTGHLGPYVAGGGVILGTPLLMPLVVIFYRLMRPRRTLADLAEERLSTLIAAAAPQRTLCRTCEREAEAGWQVCPYCSTEIRRPCPRCDAVGEVSWGICPFCAFDLRPEEDEVAAAAERPPVPSRHRRRVRPARPMPLGGTVLRPHHLR